jgi:hypothetical protein
MLFYTACRKGLPGCRISRNSSVNGTGFDPVTRITGGNNGQS